MIFSTVLVASSVLSIFFTAIFAELPGTSFRIKNAFAAIQRDGKVVAFGGGAGASLPASLANLDGVKSIFSSESAFAAYKSDGTVNTWGSSDTGGNSDGATLTNVVAVYSTLHSFAAIKEEELVVTWGDSGYGGDSSIVSSSISSGVTTISSTWKAFAAIKGRKCRDLGR